VTLKVPENQTIVIFGATGDLTGRKLLPALYNLFVQSLLPQDFAVVGYSRTEMTSDEFREHQAANVAKYSRTGLDPEAWERFARHLDYLAGGFEPEGAMHHLAQHLEEVDAAIHGRGRRMFYCAVPPSLFPKIATRLGEEGLNQGGRIVMEKPFGFDLASAKELNRQLHEVFDENQIYRIDHYLGKETVQNILVFRFGNSIFEPIWNRNHVDCVEITAAESIGIEGRGAFYEATGVVRDIIQNHLLQVMSLVTMEVPASFSADDIRDEKSQVLRSVRSLDLNDVANHCVRGQYRGYRDEEGVAPDSQTPTYAAMRFMIDSWRWQGVPFFLRSGKSMAAGRQVVTLGFREPPLRMFRAHKQDIPAGRVNEIVIDFADPGSISTQFLAKEPGAEMILGAASMQFRYQDSFCTANSLEGYERLILDAMLGDQTLFTRADGVERLWEISAPLLENPPPVEPYAPGSWGPEPSLGRLVAPFHWHLSST